MDTSGWITHSQFTKFLKAKAAEKPCPECGEEDWGTVPVAEQQGNGDPQLQVGLIVGASTHRVLPVHTLHCLNCGYLKLFNANVVHEWMDNNG